MDMGGIHVQHTWFPAKGMRNKEQRHCRGGGGEIDEAINHGTFSFQKHEVRQFYQHTKWRETDLRVMSAGIGGVNWWKWTRGAIGKYDHMRNSLHVRVVGRV